MFLFVDILPKLRDGCRGNAVSTLGPPARLDCHQCETLQGYGYQLK